MSHRHEVAVPVDEVVLSRALTASPVLSGVCCSVQVEPVCLFLTPLCAAPFAMALSKLSEDQHRCVFTQLCNVLEPRVAVYLSSTCNELRTATEALLQQMGDT